MFVSRDRIRCCMAVIVLIGLAQAATAGYDYAQFVLDDCSADGAAVIRAKAHQQVGAVRSNNDRLSDASFVTFARWRGLYGVYLWNTAITGAGFSKLEEHPYLFQVTLIGPNVNDEGVKAVSRLPHVTHLQVGNGYDTTDCKYKVHPAIVTDRSLESLATMANLKYLEIENADITDDGIQHLSSLKDVEAITFSRCPQLTLRGIKRLRLALPTAHIDAFEPDLEPRKK